MTVRAVMLGLLGAMLVCSAAFFNDRILKQTYLVGNNMPVSVYGMLIVFVLFLNPLMKRWALKGREIAVILALTLAACSIPGAGLLRCFTSSVILPHHYNRTEPGWKGRPARIAAEDVEDWPKLVEILRHVRSGPGGRAQSTGDAVGHAWRRLPPELQAALDPKRDAEPLDDARKEAVLAALNALLDDRELSTDRAIAERVLPHHVLTLKAWRPASTLVAAERDLERLNRPLLDLIFADVLAPRAQPLRVRVRADDLHGWPELARMLRAGLPDATPSPEQGYGSAVGDLRRRLWRRLHADTQSRLGAAPDAATPDADLRDAFLAALNARLSDRGLSRDNAFNQLPLPADLRATLAQSPAYLADAAEQKLRRLNRGILDVVLAGGLGARAPDVIEAIPARMLPDPSRNEDEAMTGFVQGLGKGDEHMSVGQIPWYAWTRTLLFWIPVVLTVWGAMIALSLVVHRQWSQHEHLPYPIATFTNALLPEEGRAGCTLFRSRLFWIACIGVLAIHLNNYTQLWFPDKLFRIDVRIDLSAFAQLFPTFIKGGGWSLLRPVIYFSVVGIAYFVPTDASFSFGIGPFLWALLAGTLAGYGISLAGTIEGTEGYTGLTLRAFLLFGANVGILIAMLYTGRHYYAGVLRRTLGLRSGERIDRSAVWGARIFVGLIAFLVLQLSLIGLDWQLAVMYSAIMVVFFLVMARIIAETGLFYMQPYFFPCTILWGLFGIGAIGPTTLLIMQLLTMVLLIDPRETLMPFVVNSLKLVELRKERPGRVGGGAMLAIILGLAVGLPITLYIQYDRGSSIWEGWAERSVPKMPSRNAIAVKQKLTAQGALESAEAVSGWPRFQRMAPTSECLWAMAAGLGLVLVVAAARLRFPWWPLHPLMFAVWCTYPMRNFCGAFLIGWLIKVVVSKYGGGRLYNRLKPLMIGLIAGEVLGAVLPSVVGAVYYFITGDSPKVFRILPA